MKYTFFFVYFLLASFCGFSQMTLDSANAGILYEIKKDKSGKYIKRTFKDLNSGKIYEYEANPESFGFEVRDDVISYLQNNKKRYSEKFLNGSWKLKYVTDYALKPIEGIQAMEFYDTLEFNSLSKMYISKPINESQQFMGCYNLYEKKGIIQTLLTSDHSQVIIPEKVGNKLPQPCIRSEDLKNETLYIADLDSEHLVLFQFIPDPENEDLEKTVFVHYIKVHY